MPRTYRKYTKELLEPLAKESIAVSQVCEKLGICITGNTCTHVKSRLIHFGIDMSHFLGQASRKGIPSPQKKGNDHYLICRTDKRRTNVRFLKRGMLEGGQKYQCVSCKNDGNWQGKILVLEVDHINEKFWDNRIENLQFLCPNCHGQKTLGV